MSRPEITAILDELRALGSEQTLKIYRRHGLKGEAFGVKYGDLEKLAKRLKKSPELAHGLWASGNHDASVLACKIADPASLERASLERWVGEINRVLVADFSNLVARGPLAQDLASDWTGAPQPDLTQVTGWFVVAALATKSEGIPKIWFEPSLGRIEPEIAEAPDRVSLALNEALIAIGGRNDPGLRDTAVAIAERIGKVEVDQGETGCETPDAASYIGKIWLRRAEKINGGE